MVLGSYNLQQERDVEGSSATLMNGEATVQEGYTPTPTEENPTEDEYFEGDDGFNAARGSTNLAAYGFVWYLATFLYYILVLVWGFLPEPLLHELGITYYPQKYWAVAVPAWGCLSGVFAVLTYCACNFISAAPLDSPQSYRDEHSDAPILEQDLSATDSMPPIGDLHVEEWNKLLFDKQQGQK